MADFRFQHRRTTTATADPDEVLFKGEWGIEFDDTTGAVVGAKLGDGATAWSALPYHGAGGGGGGATNLAWNAGTSTVTSDTGTDATITAVDGTNPGLMPVASKTKLDGIATGATANATDAQLRDRTTHTGEQAISTVTNLQTSLDAKADETNNVAGDGSVLQVVKVTQAAYDALTPVATTLYVIVG